MRRAVFFALGVLELAVASILLAIGLLLPAASAVRDNFNDAVKVLAKSCDIVEDVAYPNQAFGPVVSILIDAEGACSFRGLIEAGRMRELPSELGIGNPHDQDFVRGVKTHVIRARRIEEHEVADLQIEPLGLSPIYHRYHGTEA